VTSWILLLVAGVTGATSVELGHFPSKPACQAFSKDVATHMGAYAPLPTVKQARTNSILLCIPRKEGIK
jgi:hypothetical protein